MVAMEKYVLQVENLGKRYNLNRQQQVSFVEDVKARWQKVLSKGEEDKANKEIWALRGVSFGLEKGDVLGIIGKNGAGKSTLLKMLAEVTAPTEGRIEYSGNLTSILEVGTGFHPDLTGRQNVFLSASLVGLEKGQIEERFDEIVEFSGIAPFIDVPVKQYSSGMYLRLAFSLAFHTDMDILVLDEVLSVGDVDFRMKSAKRIKEISRSGTTVVLVSHELPSIRDLCSKCMLLEEGKMLTYGPTREVVDGYLEDFYDNLTSSGQAITSYLPNVVAENELMSFKGVEVRAKGKAEGAELMMEDAIELTIRYHKKTNDAGLVPILEVATYERLILSDCPFFREFYEDAATEAGNYSIKIEFPPAFFNEGTFGINLLFCFTQEGKMVMELPFCTRFTVQLNSWEHDLGWGKDQRDYPLRPPLGWKVEFSSEEP